MFDNITNLSASYFPSTKQEETKINFVDNCLPTEVILNIFSNLNVFEIVRSQRVSKKWKAVASDQALWENAVIPEVIGKTHWEKYFGDVGDVPPLPKDIEEILESACPFFPGKKVKETHMLVLIPETVDGESLTFDTLGELVTAPKEGNATQYRYIADSVTNIQTYDQPIFEAHWALMTKDVIKGSRNQSYTDQQALITELNEKTGLNYEVPCALDASICIFMHYISSGECLFTDKPLTYTRCLEYALDDQVVIGCFSSNGLIADDDDSFDGNHYGMAALRVL